jgi:hypothetical protein
MKYLKTHVPPCRPWLKTFTAGSLVETLCPGQGLDIPLFGCVVNFAIYYPGKHLEPHLYKCPVWSFQQYERLHIHNRVDICSGSRAKPAICNKEGVAAKS